jgi:hypothetical protein
VTHTVRGPTGLTAVVPDSFPLRQHCILEPALVAINQGLRVYSVIARGSLMTTDP